MSSKQVIGRYGEDLAVKFLISKKYLIMDRNYKSGHGEIDIIATIDSKIIFIEVKTRTNKSYGFADESINFKKLKNLRRAIIKYCIKYKHCLDDIRLDLIAIDIDKLNKIAKIKHYNSII